MYVAIPAELLNAIQLLKVQEPLLGREVATLSADINKLASGYFSNSHFGNAT